MPDASEGREGNQIPNCSLHRKPVQSQLTVCDTVHYIHNYDYMPRGTMGGWVGGGGGLLSSYSQGNGVHVFLQTEIGVLKIKEILDCVMWFLHS